MKLSAILEPMIAAGVSGDVILATVRAFETQHNDALERSREKGRERWKRWKNKLCLTASEWRDLSILVRERDAYACVYCSSTDEPLHVDHVRPLSQGGTNDLANLATACRACNCGKAGRTVEQWKGAQ